MDTKSFTEGVLKAATFDGGGFKGIVQLMVLEKLRGPDFRPGQHYHTLLAGTSVGALNAGMFARGMSVTDVRTAYESWIGTIFSRNWTWPLIARSKYSGAGIDKFLEVTFGDMKMKQLQTPLLVCSFSTRRNKAVYFKSWEDGELRVADVLRASMAAPTYFPPAVFEDPTIDEKDTFLDGGLANNDPAAVAYTELRNPKFNPSHDDGLTLELDSYGCGEHRQVGQMGLPWLLASKILYVLECSMDSDTDNIEQFMHAVSWEDLGLRYRRYQPTLPEDIALDDLSKMGVVKTAAALYAEELMKKKGFAL